MGDLLKHQPINKLPKQFINNICNKYNNNTFTRLKYVFNCYHSTSCEKTFGNLFEYMLTLCELNPTKPLHLNIDNTICKKFILPNKITTDN